MDRVFHRDVGFRSAACWGGGQSPRSCWTKVILSPFSLLPCVHWRANSGCSKPLGTILHGEQGPVLKVGLIVCWFVQGIKKNLFIGNCDQKIILKYVNYYKFCPRTYPLMFYKSFHSLIAAGMALPARMRAELQVLPWHKTNIEKWCKFFCMPT